MTNTRYNNGYEAVIALLREYPEWKGVVKAALEEAKTIKTGCFAGAWVLERAKKHGVSWIPNLRKLSSYGILKKEGESSRGGRRAYYKMPDVDGVERALSEVFIGNNNTPYPAHDVTDSGVVRKETIKVPLYLNLASCGSPSVADTHIDDYIDVDARRVRSGCQYYVVRADGNSMDLVGINSGDLVLVRSQNHADIGQKVVAYVEGGTTIKEFQHTGEYSVLVPRSSNKEHTPIVLSENAEIQGVVVGTLPVSNNTN